MLFSTFSLKPSGVSNRSESRHLALCFESLEDRLLLAGLSPTEVANLVASDGVVGDHFGWSVAVSGDTAVIGAQYHEDDLHHSGSVYVFTREGEGWTEQAELSSSDAAVGDLFGYSVAVSGNIMVVGAIGNDDSGMNSGSAYVFTRSGETWTEQTKLTASDGAGGDAFGNSVAVSGNTVLIGAMWDEDNGADAGSAYVFTGSGGTWTQEAKLTTSDGAAYDQFGVSIGFSGDTAVIGAMGNDDAGSAYVFSRSNGAWTEDVKLTASDREASDVFGRSVAFSGDTVVIGAEFSDNDLGSAYVFIRNNGAWTEQAKLTSSDDSEDDRFGTSVAISGDTVAIGSFLDDSEELNTGSVYLFSRDGEIWTEQAKLTVSDGMPNDRLGNAVAISGNTLVTGAFGTAGETGRAFVFNLGSNEAPVITSNDGGDTAIVEVAENQTAVTDVQTSDDNDSEQVAGLLYSISGGDDQSAFTIDEETGLLTFDNVPDFESPTDVGGNNVYEVQVTVTDSGGLTDVQSIFVNVLDVEPVSLTGDIIAEIETLNDDGSLDNGEANPIINHLEQAIKDYAKEKTAHAAQKLEQARDEMQNLLDAGNLNPAVHATLQGLIEDINVVLNEVVSESA